MLIETCDRYQALLYVNHKLRIVVDNALCLLHLFHDVQANNLRWSPGCVLVPAFHVVRASESSATHQDMTFVNNITCCVANLLVTGTTYTIALPTLSASGI